MNKSISLWSTTDMHGHVTINLPHNSDDQPYRQIQLEQIASRIHKDLRRMSQKMPGKAIDKFIQEIVGHHTTAKIKRYNTYCRLQFVAEMLRH